MKILLCDDDIVQLRNIKNSIKKLDYIDYILTANNGKDAIELIKNNPIDLIITDIDMPMINGLDLANKIKYEVKSDIMVIFVTAYPDYSINSHQTRPIDFILKPIDYNRLLDSLNFANDMLMTRELSKSAKTTDLIFTYKFRKSTNMINYDNILFFEKNGRSINIYFDNDTVSSFYENFNELKDRLPLYFFASSLKYIINLKKVYRVVPSSRNFSEIFFVHSNKTAYLDKKNETDFLFRYHKSKY